MTILPPGRIFLCGRRFGHGFMREEITPKALCLAAFSQYAKQATSVRRAEARPTRKSRVCLAWRRAQRLSRLAAFQRSQSGRHRPGGLKRCWFAAIRVGVFSALGFVLAKENPRFAGFLVCVVLCFSQC